MGGIWLVQDTEETSKLTLVDVCLGLTHPAGRAISSSFATY